MIQVAEKTGLLLMVAHCRRFDKDWGKMAQIISQGLLGRPLLWRSVSAGIGPGRWFMYDKEGGGPLIDGAVHNYDFAHVLFGDPDSVVASGIKLTRRSAVDTATAVVQYKSGDQFMISWSWGVRGDGAHDILGPKATLFFGPGDMKPPDERGYAYFRVWPLNKEPKLIKFKYDGLDMYTGEDQHFIDCLNGKSKCHSPATDSIKAVAVAEAILKAARRGGSQKVRW
jgi:predicted dehydrogenase